MNLTIVNNNDALAGLAYMVNGSVKPSNILKGFVRECAANDILLDPSATSGLDVLGCSEFTKKVNDDPAANIELAIKIGMVLSESFIGTEDEVDELARTELWMQVGRTVAIRRPIGLPVTCEAYFDGKAFKNHFVKVIGNRLAFGNTGPECGYAITTIFSVLHSPLGKQFRKLAEILAGTGYEGPATIEAVIDKENVYYKRIRFGYDETEYGKIALCGPGIIVGDGSVPKGYASTVTIYDLFEEGVTVGHKDKLPAGIIPVQANLSATGYMKSAGRCAAVSVAVGKTILESFDKCYEQTKAIRSPKLYWRSDGGRYAADWWRKAKRVFL